MILIITSVFPPEPVVSANIMHDLAVVLSEKNEVIVISPKATRPFGFKFSHESLSEGRYKHITLNSFTCPESNIIGRMRESISFGWQAVSFIKNLCLN